MRIHRMILLFFLSNCLFFSQSLFADSSCEQIKSKYSLKAEIRPLNALEKSLLQANFSTLFEIARPKINSQILSIDELKDGMFMVDLCVNLDDQAIVGSGTRKGSVYFTKEKLIVFNSKELFAHDLFAQAALNMLHEFFGALGYPDKNYELSTYFYAVLHVKSFGEETLAAIEKATLKHVKNNPHVAENIIYARSGEGGISGVGGGGDPESAFLKALLVNFVLLNFDFYNELTQFKFSIDDFAEYFSKTHIETDSVDNFHNSFKTSFPFLRFTYRDAKIIYIVKAEKWSELIKKGDSGFDERTQFVRDLILFIVANMGVEKK